jgi:O-antigen/teichoic acid export membrane protein
VSSERRLVVTNSFWLSLKPILGVVVGVFWAGYIGRHLGVDRYGNFSYALSFVQLFGFIANFGITTMLQRECAQPSADVNKLFVNSIYLKTGFLSLTLLAIVAGSLLVHVNATILWLNVILAVYVSGMSIQNSFASVFKGRSDMKPVAAVDATAQLADVMICATVLWFGGEEVGIAYSKVAVIVLAIGSYFGFLSRRVKLHWVPLDPKLAWRFLTSGSYITLITVFQPGYQLGPVMLGQSASGPRAVGLYQAANGLVERLLQFTQPINDAVFPVFAASRDDKGRSRQADFLFYLRAVLILAAGAWIGTRFLGPFLISLFFGREFAAAQIIIRILGISTGIRIVNRFAGALLLARGHDRACASIVGANVAVHVGVCALLIPHLGAIAIAYAFVTSEVVCAVLMLGYIVARGLFPIEGVARLGASMAAVVLAFAVAGWTTRRLEPSLRLNLALVAAYPIALFACRVLAWGDLARLLSVLFGSRGRGRSVGPVGISEPGEPDPGKERRLPATD